MGVIVLSTCTFLSSLVTSPYLFMLCFAIGVGFASGTSCLLPAWAGWSYYPERKGLVTGINLAGFSLGGLVYGLIFLFIANPSNIPPSIIVDRGAEKEILFD